MTGAQLWLLVWCAFLALASGLIAHFDADVGYAFGAIIGLVVLCSIAIYQGVLSARSALTSDDYFGARSLLSSESTLQSLSTTWIMLGNVVVANMFLGQTFGLLTLWVILTWAWAFVLVSYRVPRIRECLSAGDTLHSFLRDTYGSRGMQLIAASITVTVGIGVFSVEIAAGAGLLSAILPEHLARYIVPLLVLLTVIAMSTGAIIGGLRSVVQADATFYYIIIAAMLLFGVICLVPWLTATTTVARLPPVWWPGKIDNLGTAVFLLGILALQVPLLLGDFGTWQRIKATNARETQSLAKLTARQAIVQAILWGIPVISGILIATAPKLAEGRSGNLYPTSGPLIEVIRAWVDSPALPPSVRAAILAVVILGLLAVMITTANSYLMISMEAWVHDFFPITREVDVDFKWPVPPNVQRARMLCVLFALLACIPVALIVATGISLLSIVLTVFAAQVALAPPAVLALYFPEAAKRLRATAVAATITAFVLTIWFGLFVTYASSDPWLMDFGPYFAPIIALGVPILWVGLALMADDEGIKGCMMFLAKLFIPRP